MRALNRMQRGKENFEFIALGERGMNEREFGVEWSARIVHGGCVSIFLFYHSITEIRTRSFPGIEGETT